MARATSASAAVLAATATAAVTLHAQAPDSAESGQLAEWRRMQQEVIGAKALLGADLADGSGTIGRITDLVLSEASRDVEFALFEAPPAPEADYVRNQGFVAFDDLIVEPGADEASARLVEGVSPEPPAALELTAQDADNRLASKLIGNWLHFSNDELREIDNLLIDTGSGRITHYVFDLEAESLFDQNRRMVPADRISVTTQGYVMASISLRDAELLPQEYPPEFL